MFRNILDITFSPFNILTIAYESRVLIMHYGIVLTAEMMAVKSRVPQHRLCASCSVCWLHLFFIFMLPFCLTFALPIVASY